MNHSYITITAIDPYGEITITVEPTAVDHLALMSSATTVALNRDFAPTEAAARELIDTINDQLGAMDAEQRYAWLGLYHRVATLMGRDRNPDIAEIFRARQLTTDAIAASEFAGHILTIARRQPDPLLRAYRRLSYYARLMVPVVCFLINSDREIRLDKQLLSIHAPALGGPLQAELTLIGERIRRQMAETGLPLGAFNHCLRRLLVIAATGPVPDDAEAVEQLIAAVLAAPVARRKAEARLNQIAEMLRYQKARLILRQDDGQWDTRVLETADAAGVVVEQHDAVTYLLSVEYSSARSQGPERTVFELTEPLILVVRPTVDQTVIIHNINVLRQLGLGELEVDKFDDIDESALRQYLGALTDKATV